MTTDLDPRIRTYTRAVTNAQRRIHLTEVRSLGHTRRFAARGMAIAIAAAIFVLALIGGAALLSRFAPEPTVATTPTPTVPDADRSDPSGGTPFPDVDAAIPGDDGTGPLPLGTITSLPESVQLDFLFELCWTPNCFRDAHFIDPASGLGAGGFEPDTPFHVREGFPAVGEAPLGEGFDVVLYVTPFDVSTEEGGVATGPTVRYTADYVVRGETDACGPDYESQSGTLVCDWFVHEFEHGLPAGRYAMWAVWEAPCRAWVEYRYLQTCTDPDEVMSLFSSGFDAPFAVGAASYGDLDGAGLPDVIDFPEPPPLIPDATGAAPTGGTPLPDVTMAVDGDAGTETIPFGDGVALPESVQLDFLFELCTERGCFRDAHFMDPAGSGLGSGGFGAHQPFHIREGFPASGDQPLGDGFDVVAYVMSMDFPGEFGGSVSAAPVRYTADFVTRGEASACGPTYRSQEGPVVCEWFVHDFPEGLPAGRHAIWVMWQAPCWAWVEYGFVDACADPDTVMELFSSGVDSPFGGPVGYEDPNGMPSADDGSDD